METYGSAERPAARDVEVEERPASRTLEIAERAGARQLEIEKRLIEEAIALVASGRSRRVVVAGLPVSTIVLDAVTPLADRAGVRVRLLPQIRAGIVDVAIEAVPTTSVAA